MPEASAGAAAARSDTASATASGVRRIPARYGAAPPGTRRLRRMITFQSISDDNRAAVEALRIDRSQERFVNKVSEAFLEDEVEPGDSTLKFGLDDGDVHVVFVMISDEVDGSEYIAHYLWKLLI